MDDTRGTVLGVWRLGMYRRAAGYAFAVLPAAAAMSTWLELLVHPDLSHLASAGEAMAFAVGFGLFGWWVLLRVRLELTTDGIVTVNPWGTQHLPWSGVSSVSLNGAGAQFHTLDGFKYTSFALSDLGGLEPQEDRFAEVMAIVRTQVRK
ncbi:PH domain-containing protein [Streptomyces sp. RB6PN25]|uniref:PH domain-containing protein n=1 Tax=Streptomyces humicola TaxID=2953240 RepID=A0ABT1Q523_9ACTN|nr:PH domain-containing protein [Streptomyces humicola]MCQ4084430.1 PH domain-containing protein [Streptomyces humicola]